MIVVQSGADLQIKLSAPSQNSFSAGDEFDFNYTINHGYWSTENASEVKVNKLLFRLVSLINIWLFVACNCINKT